MVQEEREQMFEKPLTPSDQHAEKHLPLGSDSGLLLSFEDEAGKAWRFRYSYWTSSHSYVLTKGWSRFVKEKRLHAGDVVLFERRRSAADRLYIRWKRRRGLLAPNTPAAAVTSPSPPPCPPGTLKYLSTSERVSERERERESVFLPMVRCGAGVGDEEAEMTRKTTKATPATLIKAKRVRLFGVNLDCAPEQ
ncbi:unnamed protein product [Spirodela intermedia]|uniref:TF-B3 domain-containing protein n=1 Tax=Spirodela intermedia TaxID=51605 RepID=A0A7I8JEF2_SPIIN|nr:unnamed protein product [Spirodela intermedia]CAA6668479.1 unnamed protein product [Spirodela intermedia]